jgi:hypothetical protein
MRTGTSEDIIRDVHKKYDPTTADLLQRFITGEIPRNKKRRVPERVGNKAKAAPAFTQRSGARASRGWIRGSSDGLVRRARPSGSRTAAAQGSVMPSEVLPLRPHGGHSLGW